MIRTRLEVQYIAARLARKVLNPVPGKVVTTPYHIPGPWDLGYHTGEDYACPVGTPIVAVTWGQVVGAGWAGAPHNWGAPYGNVVLIQQGNNQHTYGYCHLSKIIVRVGDKVRPGMVLGFSGDTGNTTGPHVHFEARTLNGTYGTDVNPMYVKKRGFK